MKIDNDTNTQAGAHATGSRTVEAQTEKESINSVSDTSVQGPVMRYDEEISISEEHNNTSQCLRNLMSMTKEKWKREILKLKRVAQKNASSDLMIAESIERYIKLIEDRTAMRAKSLAFSTIEEECTKAEKGISSHALEMLD